MRLFFLVLAFAAAGALLRAQSSVPVLLRPLPAQSMATTTPPITIALTDYFAVPGVNGARFVHYDTIFGVFGVELRTDFAPRHVANFLNYVASGAYTSSFFHRAASFDNSAVSIVQGGGYTYTLPLQFLTVPKQAPIALEYSLVNARGTLAAARTTDINSATSEWYFNTRDNSTILGPANGGGYSVFGRVLGTGMTVVDRIAALPRFSATSVNPAFGELPLRNFSGGAFDQNHIVIVNSIREVGLFPALTGRSHVEFTVQNSAPQSVVTSLSGSNLTLGGIAGGNATVTIRATDVNGNFAEGTFAVTVSGAGGGVPAITTQPAPQVVASGSTTVFGVTATGAVSYQWARNGVTLTGATNATLIIPSAVAANAGSYTVAVGGAAGTTVSDPATLTVVPATPGAGRLVNLAIRTAAGTGAQTLIVGFAVGGAGTSGAKPLLLRGVGPSLAQFGLSGALADPVMTVFQGETTIATNDDWSGDAQVLARARQVGAFDLVAGGRDSALAHSPAAGAYTMQVVGKAGGTGLALAEIYDATAAPGATVPRLINVSARTQVGTGGDILIAGFVIGGTTGRTVLIRAIGPALTGFGVPGVLADPRLQLFEGDRVIRENDNWGGDLQLTTVGAGVGAFALSDSSSRDAMLLVTLAPGSYTAQVSGVNNGTGVALVEVYEVP
ncbi:MAG: peptidylprolyl isomerase [Opitutaceae bacterium]|nr:peptidylprolyl isomerase [Opitutaceae bacterium]